jgi:hypothetical protein
MLKGLGTWLSSKAPAQKAQGSEFKHQYNQNKKEEE